MGSVANLAVYGAPCGKEEIVLILMITTEIVLKSKHAQIGPDSFISSFAPKQNKHKSCCRC